MEKFELFAVHSLEKVFSDRAPDPSARLGESAGLSAWKGESVSFQIAYFWGKESRDYAKAAVDSPLADLVHVRKVVNVPCELPCHIERDGDYLRTTPGLYPDLLSELGTGADLVAGQWGSLWVEVAVPEAWKAGVYPVAVRLSSLFGGEDLGSVAVTVEVLDGVLPPLPIPHTEWFHSDCLSNYYHAEVFSEEYWRLVKNYVAGAAKRDINMILTPIFTPPLDTAPGGERKTVQLVDVSVSHGRYTFSFDKLRRWIRLCKECGVKYLEMSHLFSQWGATAAPKIMGTEDGVFRRLFGWETKADSPAYKEFLNRMLPALLQVCREEFDLDNVYFHISDEPQLSQLESYRSAYDSVIGPLAGCKMIDAVSDYEFYRAGSVQIPVCATNHIRPFLENRPEKLWCYYCTAQYRDVSNRFIAMPSYRNRIYGLQLYKHRIDGILHWGYNFYNSVESLYPVDPYRTTGSDGAFPSGDPFLVYPGADGRPRESIRMMVFYEAMTDLRALSYLESLIGREEVLRQVDLSGVTFDSYPRSADFVRATREKVNSLIVRNLA